jgi:hypothetical protein
MQKWRRLVGASIKVDLKTIRTKAGVKANSRRKKEASQRSRRRCEGNRKKASISGGGKVRTRKKYDTFLQGIGQRDQSDLYIHEKAIPLKEERGINLVILVCHAVAGNTNQTLHLT